LEVSMEAPKACQQATALSVSLEIRGQRIRLAPSARDAIATARMVCDLEAGIETVPERADF